MVQVQMLAGLQTRKSQCFSSSLKAKKSPCPRSKGIIQEKFSFLWGGWTSADWISPTHPKEGSLFIHSTYLNVYLIQNTFTETPRIMYECQLGFNWIYLRFQYYYIIHSKYLLLYQNAIISLKLSSLKCVCICHITIKLVCSKNWFHTKKQNHVVYLFLKLVVNKWIIISE